MAEMLGHHLLIEGIVGLHYFLDFVKGSVRNPIVPAPILLLKRPNLEGLFELLRSLCPFLQATNLNELGDFEDFHINHTHWSQSGLSLKQPSIGVLPCHFKFIGSLQVDLLYLKYTSEQPNGFGGMGLGK